MKRPTYHLDSVIDFLRHAHDHALDVGDSTPGIVGITLTVDSVFLLLTELETERLNIERFRRGSVILSALSFVLASIALVCGVIGMFR